MNDVMESRFCDRCGEPIGYILCEDCRELLITDTHELRAENVRLRAEIERLLAPKEP
jgi:hypothetical protein